MDLSIFDAFSRKNDFCMGAFLLVYVSFFVFRHENTNERNEKKAESLIKVFPLCRFYSVF
jgi:hypothetical protein